MCICTGRTTFAASRVFRPAQPHPSPPGVGIWKQDNLSCQKRVPSLRLRQTLKIQDGFGVKKAAECRDFFWERGALSPSCERKHFDLRHELVLRWRRNGEFQARPHHKITARVRIKRSVSKSAYLRWYLLVRKTTWLGLGSSRPTSYSCRLRHAGTLEGLRRFLTP